MRGFIVALALLAASGRATAEPPAGKAIYARQAVRDDQ